MRLQAKKIHAAPKPFELYAQGLCFKGEIFAKDHGLFCIKASLKGELELICDRSGEGFLQSIDEQLVLYVADGIWDTQSQHLDTFDVIECVDGFIDLDSILQSEIESIKLDYHSKEGD